MWCAQRSHWKQDPPLARAARATCWENNGGCCVSRRTDSFERASRTFLEKCTASLGLVHGQCLQVEVNIWGWLGLAGPRRPAGGENFGKHSTMLTIFSVPVATGLNADHSPRSGLLEKMG